MEERLDGGNAGGAVLADGTVRRATGPWTPAVHAVLHHLEASGFTQAPRALGVDDQGREVLSHLPGRSIGSSRPWPAWVHSDDALWHVGRWLRDYHSAVADFVPPAAARWRTSQRPWRPGDVIGHNDAAPYNAVWTGDSSTGPAGQDPRSSSVSGGGGLVGFIDWDFAAPCSPIWDLAFVVFSWVPLHACDVVAAEGFTAFADRPRRLRLLLDAYGWSGGVQEVLSAVVERMSAHADDVRELAEQGDPLFKRVVAEGAASGLERALCELAGIRDSFS